MAWVPRSVIEVAGLAGLALSLIDHRSRVIQSCLPTIE